MEMEMEAMGPVVEVASKCVCGPICRQIGYLKNLAKNFEQLNKKVERLNDRMEDVQRKISGKRPTSECKGWLREAEVIQSKWKEIQEEYQKNMTCLGGCCPNVVSKSRLNLGRRIVALIQETDDSIEKSDFKEDMVVDEPQQIMEMPATRIQQGNTAADRILQELLSMIKEASINSIGLWGMGGVGKTTILKVLNTLPEIIHMFDIVLWVTVSKEGTNRNVQDEIVRRLKVQREDGESNDSLKSKVFVGLKAKKFLLFLDDVWHKIDLEEVGVPLLDQGNGCKVVLATRDHRVCLKMETDCQIEVKTLSEEEAWLLFPQKVGAVADDSRIKALARKVAMECCGLPLAIVVVAGALRNEEDIRVWRYALKELSSAGEIEDMEGEVYRSLKYSYDRLKDERSKECFLYCALFPDDYHIRKTELIKYWINDGLIDGWSDLEEAEDNGFSKLKELMDASLLEKGETENFVKMHDVMRDLAIRISSLEGEGRRSLVKAGLKLSEVPNVEDWEKAKRISLMCSELNTLPPMPPNCRLLTTLLLQQNNKLSEIPSDFFVEMPALQVLHLSDTGIKSLPPSIGSLANLRGLYLNNCKFLKAIPKEVGALIKLETFEMKGRTEVCYLPPEIGDLAALKHLDVKCGPSDVDEQVIMKMFPRMAKLSRLERLGIHMENAKAAEWWAKYHSEGVSKDISMLNKLTHLSLTFSKIEHFEHFVQQRSSCRNQLRSFRLLIDQADSVPQFVLSDWNSFKYALEDGTYSPGFYFSEDEIRGGMVYNDDTKKTVFDEMLTCIDSLAIGDRVPVQRLSEFGLEKMKELKYCFAIGCKYIETIVDDADGSNGKQNGDLLPKLKWLVLRQLPNLKGIWEGPPPSPSPRRKCFPSLKILMFIACPRLKRVLSRGLFPHLSNLEGVRVEDCSAVEEIISMDKEEGDEETVLPRLKKLILIGLPKLTSIYSNKEFSSTAGWPSLERIRILDCEKLKSLPRGFSNAPNLKKISCRVDWWETLEWEDDAFKQQLCSKLVDF